MSNVRKGRSINAALCKKGFRKEMDGDHVCYELPGSDVRTKISHGMLGRDIGRELLGKMARQVHLNLSQFLDLIDCPLGKESYQKILLDQKLIS